MDRREMLGPSDWGGGNCSDCTKPAPWPASVAPYCQGAKGEPAEVRRRIRG
jgi:hypothetical protein